MIEPQFVVPGVHFLPFEIGQVYLWDWGEGLTVVDSGVRGSADAIVSAIAAIGRRPADVREIVLTHFHGDHVGAAADLAQRTGARVLAGAADAPVIRGLQPGVPPDLTELERPLAAMLFADGPPPSPPPVNVDDEVGDGHVAAGGGTIISVPGHTPGSIALLVPQLGVLFAGDTIASYEGAPIPGPFNANRIQAQESLRKQATLEFEVACFGHGAPIVSGASRKLLALVRSL
jgi:glyoxylase-like metal-dependent hydrolase (beta-lactamase superfamily II)